VIRPIHAAEAGTIQHIHGRRLGMVLVGLGAGRRRPDDEVDPAIGITDVLGVGEHTDKDRPLLTLHARDEAGTEHAAALLRA